MTPEVMHPTIPILMLKETKAVIPKKKSFMDLVKTFALKSICYIFLLY